MPLEVSQFRREHWLLGFMVRTQIPGHLICAAWPFCAHVITHRRTGAYRGAVRSDYQLAGHTVTQTVPGPIHFHTVDSIMNKRMDETTHTDRSISRNTRY